jgi:AcrR family transcriptional regulator
MSEDDYNLTDPGSHGLRERKKAATRESLHAAALRLFAERGYGATTVADIAAVANVSERTFFRYFRSKEDVALDDATRFVPELTREIRARPAGEPPLVSLREAFVAVVASAENPQLALLYSGPPASWSAPVTMARLRLLVQLETAVAAALRARVDGPVVGEDGAAGGRQDQDEDYRLAVAARAGVVAFRSALIRYHELGGGEAVPAARFVALVLEAFAMLGAGTGLPSR